MKFTLGTRNARALAANFYAADKRAQNAVRKVVRKNGVALHAAAYQACPVDSGFMQSQLRLKFSEGGFVYEVGWSEADFEGAGLAFYPVYVLFGTRTQAPNDFFFPLRDRQLQAFRAELSEALSAAAGRRRGGRPGAGRGRRR